MKLYKLSDMKGGWFIGDFSPTALQTKSCEVALKKFKASEIENLHYHKIATEITLVIDGHIEMCNKKLGPGDIIIVEPGDSSSFFAITDATIVAVKTPSIPSDKYLGTQ